MLSQAKYKRPRIFLIAPPLILFVALMVFDGEASVNFGRNLLQKLVSHSTVQQADDSASPAVPTLAVGPQAVNGSTSNVATPDLTEAVPALTVDQHPPADSAPPATSPQQPSLGITRPHPKTLARKIMRMRSPVFAGVLAPKPISSPREAAFVPPAFNPPSSPDRAARIPELFSSQPAPAAPAGESIKQSGKSVTPQLVFRKNPVYPDVAKTARLSGPVELHFTIKRDGTVHNVSVTKGNAVLAKAAVDAVQDWRYLPGRRDGSTIETESSAVIIFNLD